MMTMSTIYILKEDCEESDYHKATPMADEKSAYSAAIAEIMNNLKSDGLDDQDHDYHDSYLQIRQNIDDDDLHEAIHAYNRIPDIAENYSEHTYICIECQTIMTHDGNKYHEVRGEGSSSEGEEGNYILKKVEKPCTLCKRMNDFDAPTCWCCGQKPF